MPGPKMGPRPKDFDENLVKQAPSFIRWQKLAPGQKLRYACRDFVKGHGDDEERLMRRIMIARRNNLRDHAILKRARAQTGPDGKPIKPKLPEGEEIPTPPPKKKRGNIYAMTDEEVMREMDTPAVEATRSYKVWLGLEDGQTFTYNQTYIKGKEGHDWLLKKNIWRRMRYRRENKKMVEKMKGTGDESATDDEFIDDSDHHQVIVPEASYHSVAAAANAAATAASVATHIVDHALPGNLLAGTDVGALNDAHDDNLHDDVVEAAVAAAESYVKRAFESDSVDLGAPQGLEQSVVENGGLSVHNPIMSVPSIIKSEPLISHHHTPNPLVRFDGDALDVAAKLAAAASVAVGQPSESDEEFNHTPV
jgi:hypothetical protein